MFPSGRDVADFDSETRITPKSAGDSQESEPQEQGGARATFGHYAWLTAHSDEILPLSEQWGATGPDNALIGKWPNLHYCCAEMIPFSPTYSIPQRS